MRLNSPLACVNGPFRVYRRKGFSETDCARLIDFAHQQLGGPIVLTGTA
ncbi:hypothetical protein OHB54_39705 [Streptomyces sp. NBC_01007]|nr:hypothetical protein OHB54_39705 [Streptomyces sp. NBC_01007]